MRVLITGGTGLVGSHTVAAVERAGHEPRLLVRDPARMPRAGLDHVVGDVTDGDSVAKALDGCDAVLHAASVVSLHVRDADEVLAVNRHSAEVVLAQAVELGLDPVVHVSSIAALEPAAPGKAIGPDAPVTTKPGTYARSKAAAEQVARRLQDAGAPVVTVYPTMVLGPRDPNVGEGTTAVRNVLRGVLRVFPPGGMHIVDVRDLAAVHAKLLAPGKGPRRYVVAGHARTTDELIADLRRLTGRAIRTANLPVGVAHAGGRLADALQRVVPVRFPLSYEAVQTLTEHHPCDDSRTWADLGLAPRPLDDTLVDTVRWMVEGGLLTPDQAGALAP